MKSKKEIEDYLGMKIEPYYTTEVESIYGEEQVAYDRYVMGQRIPVNYSENKALPKRTEDAIKKLIKESIEKNDMETAFTCHSILIENTTSYRDLKSIDGLNKEQIDKLMKYEQEAREKAEEQARLKAEQEAKEKAEEQARLKAEQEAKEKEEEQARLKAEQDAKERAEEQARLKAEQESKEKEEEQARIKAEQDAKERREEQARIKAEQEKTAKIEEERQASIDNDIKEYEQYEELVTRKPEIEELYDQLSYEDFSSQVDGHISERMDALMKKVNELSAEEKRIFLSRYNKTANYQINEQGVFADENVRKNTEQEVRAGAKDQAKIRAEQEAKEKAKEQSKITEQDFSEEKDLKVEQEEKTKRSTLEDHIQFMQSIEPQIKAHTDKVMDEYWSSWSNRAKTHEQQQPEKIKQHEESIKDEIGDEFKETEKQRQNTQKTSVDLWMNRFGSWYGAIDRVYQGAKAKFVKMKSDIVKAISNKIKERSNNKDANKDQEQNQGGR